MKIPCKDCLLLAACKQKQKVECNLLYDWVDEMYKIKNVYREVINYLPVCGLVHDKIYFHLISGNISW
jgi:hypothetical protein